MIKDSKKEKTIISFLMLLFLCFAVLNTSFAAKIEKNNRENDISKKIVEKNLEISEKSIFDFPSSTNSFFKILAEDSYEPDDTIGTANWIETNGTIQTHTFDPAGENDTVKFNASKGVPYIISTLNTTPGTDTFLFLRNESNALFSYNDDINHPTNNNSRLIYNSLSEEILYVQIEDFFLKSDGTHGYNLSIEIPNDTTIQEFDGTDSYEIDNNYSLANTITVGGAEQNHSFGPYINDDDFMNFSAVNNTWYVIETINRTNQTDTALFLYDTEGNNTLEIENDIGAPYNNNSRLFWKSNETATFYFSCYDYYEKGGNYSVWIYEPNFTYMEPNGTIETVNLNFTHHTEYFKFNATENESYFIRTLSDSPTDPYIKLYHENGTFLNSSDDISSQERDSKILWEAPENGTYYVLLSNFVGGEIDIAIGEQGIIQTNLIRPTGDKNVTQNGTFKVISKVTCLGGSCGNVTAKLDPKQSREKIIDKSIKSVKESETKIDKKIPMQREKDEEIDLLDSKKQTYLVLLKEKESFDFSTQSKKSIRENIRKNQEQFLTNHPDINVKRKYNLFNVLAVNATPEEVAELRNDPNVLNVEPDREYKLFLSESASQINATKTWLELDENGENLTGKGQTVCVIDSGINYSHPNLKHAYLDGYDFYNDDTDPMDDNGHGTHVAGTIASNDTTYRGIAPDAGIISIKTFDSDGDGYMSDVVSGIDWCVNNASDFNITVISMSLGNDCDLSECWNTTSECETANPTITTAIDAATDADITVIVSSGNNGISNEISSPACVGNAISVGSVGDGSGLSTLDAVSSFSNSAPILDLLAPGNWITSTSLVSGSDCSSGGEFSGCSGTSMATPHVSGAVAIMNQFNKAKNGYNLEKAQVLDILEDTGKSINDTRNNLNFSRIDIYEAIIFLSGEKSLIPTNPDAKPFYTIHQNPRLPENLTCLQDMNDGDTCEVTWVVNATGEQDSEWEFFVEFEPTQASEKQTRKINITISSEEHTPQIEFNTPQTGVDYGNTLPINVTAWSNTSLIETVEFRWENSTENGTWTNLSLNDSINDIWYYEFDTTNFKEFLIRVRANNSLGTSNNTTKLYDVSAPKIDILSTYPQNTDKPWLNYSISEGYSDKVWFVLDNQEKIYLTGNDTINLTLPGKHTITLYANDTSGNQNSSTFAFSENFAMNMSNWTNELNNSISDVKSITVQNSTTEITDSEETMINTTLNLTLETENFNTTFLNFQGLNASWTNKLNSSEQDENVEKAVLDAGLNSSKIFSTINTTSFLQNENYNATVEFKPNSTSIDEIFYCPNVSSTFSDAGVDNHTECNGDGAFTGCYNTTICYDISPCNGDQFSGTECYIDSVDYVTVFLPHLSAVTSANDTINPTLSVSSPEEKEYTGNVEVSDLIANITTSNDVPSCNYSLNGDSNQSMSSSSSIFTADLGSPLLNGEYNISFYCKDYYDNTNSSTVLFNISDTTDPTLSATEDDIETDEVDIDITTDEPVFGVVFYAKSTDREDRVEDVDESDCEDWTSFTDADDIEDEWIDDNNGWIEDEDFCDGDTDNCFVEILGDDNVYNDMLENPTITLSSLNEDTEYYYGVCLCDKQRNCELENNNMYFETDSEDDDDDNGGTSGTSGTGSENTTTQTTASSKIFGFWSEIVANEETEWTISSSTIPVGKVYFTLTETLSDVNMELSTYDGGGNAPSGLPNAPNNVYSYIKVVSPQSHKVRSAKMEFSIPSSWFSENGYDKERVKAYHYEGGEWEILFTRVVSTSGSEYEYELESNGFSYFALTAPNAPPEIVPDENENETIDNSTGNQTIIAQKIDVKCGDGFCDPEQESCVTCEKDCGPCVFENTTTKERIMDFVDLYVFNLYYIYISAGIIVGAIVFSIVMKKGKSSVFEEKKKKTKNKKKSKKKSKKGKKPKNKKQEPKKGIFEKIKNIFKRKGKEDLDLSKKPKVFKLE